MSAQNGLAVATASLPAINGFQPFYTTELGAAYLGDSLDLLRAVGDESVNMVMTSPPYALHFKKAYGNVDKGEYVEWFLRFAREIFRILAADGSFVLNIGGSYNQGEPTKSLYHFKLLIALVEEIGFHLAQECFWHNPAKMPVPAEWVTVRKIRIKDSVEYVWWLSKTPWPRGSNQKVLKDSFSKDMHRLNKKGVRPTQRPSGHKINKSWSEIKTRGAIPSGFIQANLFQRDDEQIPESVLIMGNNAANDEYTMRCKEAGLKVHPARFPAQLPRFFMEMLTDEGDVVLDPFAGSNTAGAVAEELGRRWVALDNVQEYLEASKFRFSSVFGQSPTP